MSNSIIIITPPDNGQIDGVSTFCRCLSEELARTGVFNVSVVTPSEEVRCLTPYENPAHNGAAYFKCPVPARGEGVGKYIDGLSRGLPCAVLLNYWPSIFNIRSIRSYMPSASVIQIVHDLPWLSFFEGDPDNFLESYASGFAGFVEGEKKFLKYSTYDTLVSFKETDRIICLCPDTLEFINRHYQIPIEKISLIPNGLCDVYPAPGAEMPCHAYATGKRRILFIGRPSLSKGWDRVINLAAYFNKENINAEIICVGFNGLNDLIPWNLRSYFVEMGILTQHELNDLYRQVDFVFIPTRHEQCSYVAIEAMMHSKEIVAFDSYGLRNMLDSQCAYIIGTVDQFPSYSAKKGECARKRYLERYTTRRMSMNYTNFLSRLFFS